MSGAGTVTLELLGQLLRDVQRELGEMRRERRLDVELVTDLVRRVNSVDTHVGEVDGHIGELRSDLELTIRVELMGRLGMFETEVGHRLDRLVERIADPEGPAPSM